MSSSVAVGEDDWASFNMNSACVSFSKACFCRGRVTVKRLPTPGWLSTLMLPWWISTISFTSDSPIPDEGWRIFSFTSVSKRWKRVRNFSVAIPIPSSATSMSIVSLCGVTLTVIALPLGVYLNALESRLKNIFSNLSRSIQPKTDSVADCIR